MTTSVCQEESFGGNLYLTDFSLNAPEALPDKILFVNWGLKHPASWLTGDGVENVFASKEGNLEIGKLRKIQILEICRKLNNKYTDVTRGW